MKKALYIVLPVLLLALTFMAGRETGRKAAISRLKPQVDTLYQTRVITAQNAPQIALRKIAQIPVIFPVHDTIASPADTAGIILDFVQNIQQDTAGLYIAYVSGLAYGDMVPQLDSIHINVTERTIVKESVITETKKLKPRYSLGVSAGYGLNLASGQVQGVPFVGVSVQYNLLSWGYK